MITPLAVSALIFAYLLGSFPSAVWIGKMLYGVDVREFGSGNAGATNTFRVLGKKAGIPVLILDILKGWVAVNMTFYLLDDAPGTAPYVNMQIVLGLAALLGHIFPLFAGFRGGKGIATLLGIMLAIQPAASSVAILVFVAVFLVSGYVSLGSMSAGFTFPFIIMLFFNNSVVPSLVIFSFLVAILILITHQKNIERLIKRQESKTRLLKKKQSVILK
ncbi:MAG: glycerol-3-phosphate 1-O-acyltransferase PlsY [Bacteroidia bacterium]